MAALHTCKFSIMSLMFFLNRSSDEDEGRLLDPSCSGSGIVNRLDHLVEPGALVDASMSIMRPRRRFKSLITPHRVPTDDRRRKSWRCANRAPREACSIPASNATSRHEMYLSSPLSFFPPFAVQLTTAHYRRWHLTDVVPSVEKIVYSTCSIHPEENERVVAAALRSTEATAGGFTLAPRATVLPTWSRRGQPGILDDTGGCHALIWPSLLLG